MAESVLTFPRSLWYGCMAELKRRGRGLHESGCFVLGKADGRRKQAVRCVYYDDLDPEAYASGVCVLDGRAFPKVWEMCRAEGLTVLADVHTHFGAPYPSEADRQNPMIARAGHLAVIVPRFAEGVIWRHRLGLYRYEGDHRWTNLSGWRARRYLKVRWSWK
jgi:proteasome lid subunit RPN8/RPN11